MRKIENSTKKNTEDMNDELLPEYEVDYSKVKRNPYFRKNRTFVEIDNDIADLFQSPDNINKVLKVIAKSVRKTTAAVL